MLLLIHAMAHLVGFVWPWWIMEPLPYDGSAAGSAMFLDDASMRALSVLWLATAVAFGIAALACLFGRRSWRDITTGAAAASLVLSIACWPGSLLGVAINVAILAVLRGTTPRGRAYGVMRPTY
jgi:hypothetical protein